MLSPTLIALLAASALVCAVTVAAALRGLPAVVGWDPDDGGRRQLERERRLLLVETTLKVAFACQLPALALFVGAADRLHPYFPGAMCAAGTLAASPFGYPTLGVKVAAFTLCGLWLVLHRASVDAADTAVVRSKHGLALAVAAVMVAENALQFRYFADLEPEILTSCCATLFAAEGGGLAADLAALPPPLGRALFFALLGLTLAAGLRSLLRRRGTLPFALLAVALGGASAAAVVSWVAPGFYQLPTHHCPFCLVSRELGYVGYPLYLLLFGAVITGAGSGLVHGLRALDRSDSLRPAEERRLCVASMSGFALFALLAAIGGS